MALILFDDKRARAWTPFTVTRPAGELLFGCLTLRGRAERFWGEACVGHVTDPHLDGFAESGAAPVLERSTRVASLAATFDWDDVGSWEGLTRSREADPDGNVVVGSGHIVEGKRNVIYAEGGTVATFGVDDLVVVKCGDMTLVTTTERAPDLKRLLEQLPSSIVDPTASRGSA